jgi:hypothetical protein
VTIGHSTDLLSREIIKEFTMLHLGKDASTSRKRCFDINNVTALKIVKAGSYHSII